MTRNAIVLSGLLLAASLPAQNRLDVTVANLSEDIRLLTQEVARLRLEVREVQRENEALRASLQNAVQPADLNRSAEELRRAYAAADASLKREVVAEFSRQLEALAKRTEAALKALADVSAAAPSLPTTVTFDEDYPREGVAYTVRSGDTLSEIARLHNSSVRDIQNANRIADPTKIQVGQTLFIPQRSQ